MRLNKFLAHCGVDSRRNCDELIFQGRVKVDGETITTPGAQIDELSVEIRVDGDLVKLKGNFTYIKLHKPKDYVTSRKDPHNALTVMNLLPNVLNVVPVGRLDKDTTGILLLTDDGDLNFKLTHPKHGVEKELPKGIILEDNGDKVKGEVIPLNRKRTHYSVVLKEGKKREVKRIFHHYETRVYRLHRNTFAGITANELAPGRWKKLTALEIEMIKKAAE